MRDKQIVDLWEAYQQVHQLDEIKDAETTKNDRVPDLENEKKAKPVPGMKVNKPNNPVEEGYKSPNKEKIERQANKAYKTERSAMDRGDDDEAMRQIRRRSAMNNPAGRRAELEKKNKPTVQKAHFEPEMDLFDYILEYLVAEGYADTNENALVIMANMSEEWRSSIVEEVLDEANRAERELGLSSRERERARNLQGNLSKPIFYGKRNSQLGNTSDSGMNRMHKRLRNKRRTEHEERRGQG